MLSTSFSLGSAKRVLEWGGGGGGGLKRTHFVPEKKIKLKSSEMARNASKTDVNF